MAQNTSGNGACGDLISSETFDNQIGAKDFAVKLAGSSHEKHSLGMRRRESGLSAERVTNNVALQMMASNSSATEQATVIDTARSK